VIGLCSCASQAPNRLGGNYSFKTECLGNTLDGSLRLKAHGKGKTKTEAIDQAMKTAVNEVIFTGIQSGSSDCSSNPILVEPNAKTRHQDYFFDFFKTDGAYANYVELEGERFGEKLNNSNKKNARNSVAYSAVLFVKHNKLEKRLIKDGILK
jgi:hypothetical protein